MLNIFIVKVSNSVIDTSSTGIVWSATLVKLCQVLITNNLLSIYNYFKKLI